MWVNCFILQIILPQILLFGLHPLCFIVAHTHASHSSTPIRIRLSENTLTWACSKAWKHCTVSALLDPHRTGKQSILPLQQLACDAWNGSASCSSCRQIVAASGTVCWNFQHYCFSCPPRNRSPRPLRVLGTTFSNWLMMVVFWCECCYCWHLCWWRTTNNRAPGGRNENKIINYQRNRVTGKLGHFSLPLGNGLEGTITHKIFLCLPRNEPMKNGYHKDLTPRGFWQDWTVRKSILSGERECR